MNKDSKVSRPTKKDPGSNSRRHLPLLTKRGPLSTGTFVEYGTRVTSALPVVCSDTTMYGVLINTHDLAPLTEICFKVFDRVSGGLVHCEPIVPFLLLQFNTSDWLGNPLQSPLGVGEYEALIHIPVNYTWKGNTESAFFTPYMWVNDSLAMAGGREVYGYPKAFGKIEIIGDPDSPDTFSLETLSGTQRGVYSPGPIVPKAQRQYLSMQPLIVVKKSTDPTRPPPQDLFSFILNQDRENQENGTEMDSARLDSARLVFPFVKLVRDWLTDGDMPQLFLRQFRDNTTGGEEACFQQIARATYTTDPSPSFHSIPEGYDLEIQDFDSSPIGNELGLHSCTLDTMLTRAEVDHVTISRAEVLWQAL